MHCEVADGVLADFALHFQDAKFLARQVRRGLVENGVDDASKGRIKISQDALP